MKWEILYVHQNLIYFIEIDCKKPSVLNQFYW